MAKRERKPTVTQLIMADVDQKLSTHAHDLTRKQYRRQVKQYVRFCREQYNCRTFDECKSHIQNYSDFLQKQGYAASTIHTYLAAICSVFDVGLASIQKPIRYVSEYVRGRDQKNIDAANDLNNPRWSYLIEFQRRVGIRRDELMRLKGKDFVIDESGHFCVYVARGKGGKKQMQRIADRDVAFIKSYFDAVAPNESVFEEKYFKNDLNLHKLRADCAKKYYYNQLEKLKSDPSYRAVLENEIRHRWTTTNFHKNGKPKTIDKTELYGIYTLRGKNRQLAINKGLDIHYDKLALLATSMFKLSHFRNDVTIASYLLA